MPGEYDRYNMRRLVSLRADTHGQDFGRVSDRVAAAVKAAGEPPRGVNVSVYGQAIPLQEMLAGLAVSLGLTVVVVFLLLTAYFQSPSLSLIVMFAVLAAVAGAILSLQLTRTTLNLQSFMSTIMAIGVALANSILLVTFAERTLADLAKTQGNGAATAGEAAAQGGWDVFAPFS